MAAPAIPTQAGKPSNAFVLPLSRLPRGLRLVFLIAFRSISGFVRHDGLTWSAAMAFWLVLSLPPLLIALSSLMTVVLGQEMARTILADQVASQVPAQGEIIKTIVQQDISLLSPAGLGSLIFLLFSGSRVFAAMVRGINEMWRHVEEDGFLRRQAMRIVMTLGIGGLLVASVLLQLGILGAREEIGAPADIAARYVVPFVLATAGLFVTYLLIPRGRATWRTALVGAVIATIVLRAAQVAFTFVLDNFIDFSTGYGSLAGVAILMTWAVVASGIVLVGAEFVATLDRHRLTQVPLPSSSTGDPGEGNTDGEGPAGEGREGREGRRRPERS